MKNIHKFLILLFAPVLLWGCEDFLELEPPQEISNEIALNSIDKIETAVVGIYDNLQNGGYYGRDYPIMSEISADNIKLRPVNSNRFIPEYQYTFNPTGRATNVWNSAYSMIARANNVINNVDAVDGDPAEKAQLKGEALFLRALGHFDLVRMFAQDYNFTQDASHLGVPVVLQTEIGSPGRSTVAEVYAQVEADLDSAMSMITQDKGCGFTSANAAMALKARVLLYKGDDASLQESIQLSTQVIESGSYSMIDSAGYLSAWGTDCNPEIIFEVQYNLADNPLPNSWTAFYVEEVYGDIAPTTDIITLLQASPNDVRGTEGPGGVIQDVGGDLYIYKFPGNASAGIDNYPVIRLSELYLNRAEAYLGISPSNPNAARADVNTIRENRGLDPLGAGVTGSNLLNAVLEERRKEFAFEGHRYHDIKRLQIDLVRNDCSISNCVITYPNDLFAYPIPQREIDSNPGIREQQNPGY